MEFNKSIFERALLSIILLASFLVAEAQDTPAIAVTPKIGQAHVEKGGVYYAVVDKTLEYEIAVTGGTYRISKANWVLKRDNTDVASSNDTTRLISFNADKDGLYKLTGEVTLTWQVNEKDTSTLVKVTNVPDVRFLPIPNLEIVGSSNIVSYHDREFEFKFSTTTKDGSWDINMTPDRSEVKIEGSGLSFKSKLSNTTNQEKTFKVNADCRYLYEGKELYSAEKVFEVIVYPQIGIENPDTEEWNTANKISRTFYVSVKGGYPDGWTYEWKRKNGDSKYTPNKNSITIDVTPSKSVKNETYEVTAINKYENEEFGRVSKTFNVNIFPETSLGYVSPSEFHISKDSVITLEVKPVGGNESGWEYSWKEKTEGRVLPCTDKVYERGIEPGDETKTYIYEVVAINKYNNDILAELSKDFTVTVYAKPRVEQPYFRETVVGGIELERYITHSGGNPDGWKYTWYRNDEEIPNANDSIYSFVENNDGTDFVERTISVRVENYFGDQKWFDETYDFSLKVYPNVSKNFQIVPGDLHLYQQSVTMGVRYSGGCNEGTWDYKWYKGNTASEAISDSMYYDHKSFNKSTEGITQDKYILSVVHKYNEETLMEEDHVYIVYNYPLAKVVPTTSNKVVISGGNKVNFGIKADFANPDGWTYQWIRDDEILPSEKNASLSMTELNSSETETIDHTYSVIATNRYGSKIWAQDTLKFESTVRPAIIEPTKINYDINMREGDDVNLKAKPGRGGYPDGWTYQWYNSYNTHSDYEINGQDTCELSHRPKLKAVAGYNMQSEEMYYALLCKNVDGPTGTVLYESTIKYEIVLHRPPLEPFELSKKGGSANKSNIYIADMYKGGEGLNDARLSDYKYNFCFGYGNTVIEREDPTVRYYQYTKQQANEGPWVYTYWEYPDGYICKSDVVYYGSSRATTSIDGVYDNSVIKINSNGFTATLSSEMPAVARVISINGEVVKEMQYECSADFDERFEFHGLKSGFYLIEVCIGDNREVNKVFVNE